MSLYSAFSQQGSRRGREDHLSEDVLLKNNLLLARSGTLLKRVATRFDDAASFPIIPFQALRQLLFSIAKDVMIKEKLQL